jgi:putative AdoMet-dependent methyltransferase
MSRTPEEQRALFDRWSSNYDPVGHGTGPLLGYDGSLDEAASMVQIPAGARVLDVGIGTGNFAERFARRGARIWGIDISPKMLERCRLAHPDFHLSSGSFNPLPHITHAFDTVVSAFAYHEVARRNRGKACAEMARVLEPGGRLCLVDIIFASGAARDDAKRRLGNQWDDEEEYMLVGDLDGLLRDAGFTDLHWRQTAPCHWAVTGRLAE